MIPLINYFSLVSRTNSSLTTTAHVPQVVSFVLIGIGTYSKSSSIVADVAIISGTIGCGLLLFVLSLIGFMGSHKHNQVLLFFVSSDPGCLLLTG